MRTEKNIFIVFILNLAFSAFEFIGGIFTGSVAIISDAIHDVGDATSIGIAFFLEKKSKRQPDETHTYGYTRYSVIGSVITTLILLFGSVTVIYHAVLRIIQPTEINYNGMLAFAIVGICVNLGAALVAHGGESLNQKAVRLHMCEDVLGWIVVLIGAILMRFTNFNLIDPLMSIGVSLFILISALKTLKEAVDLFLEKTPRGVCIEELKQHIHKINGVLDVHHIHVWSMDGYNNYATMHIVTQENACDIKNKIRAELETHGIGHATLELEAQSEHCHARHCHVKIGSSTEHHHHHH